MVALKILQDETGQPINSWTLMEVLFSVKIYIRDTSIYLFFLCVFILLFFACFQAPKIGLQYIA